jgi:NOL1/NOP2/fmu family ribosome biogenesis protein
MSDDSADNDGSRFARLPATADERVVEGRVSRQEVVEFWDERFGVPPATWDDFTFWEKGAGRIWALHGDTQGGLRAESLGLPVLRTRQEHWKPTTDAVQRFGRVASQNVIRLDLEEARRFLAGDEQDLDWDGDWGYLIASHEIAGDWEPIGVGLYTYDSLTSMVPKGRRREL